jgi:hypothetical protein
MTYYKLFIISILYNLLLAAKSLNYGKLFLKMRRRCKMSVEIWYKHHLACRQVNVIKLRNNRLTYMLLS